MHIKFVVAQSPPVGSVYVWRDGDRFNSCQKIYSQFGLAIHKNDHRARRRFVEWAQIEIAVVPDFHKRILFSDEAHFWLNGYVNKQNCRIWSEANPKVYVKTLLHSEKLTVWCALWAGGIIGPYFFKNDEGHNFQQDGETCHTARATIDLLTDTFGDRLISRFGPVNWPPRSCDSTPLDYFLWGYVKSLVYADKPQTLDHLEDNIHRIIADIRPQTLEKVIESWTSRLDYIRASRGSHMPEIIFKMIQFIKIGRKKLSLAEEERKNLPKASPPPTFQRFLEKSAYVRNRDGIDLSSNFQKHPYGRQVTQTWSLKMMPTWLYRQYFAKFPLKRHYNVK
ncbi:putative transposase [Trichonephila clavipes]|nr:putative transposase [Trichonephila clavipes]